MIQMKKAFCCILMAIVLCFSGCGNGSADPASGMGNETTGLTESPTPESLYGDAVALLESGDYEQALAAFSALGEFADAVQKAEECRDRMTIAEGEKLEAEGDYSGALKLLLSVTDGARAKEALSSYYRVFITEENFYEYFSVVADEQNAGSRVQIADTYAPITAKVDVEAEFLPENTTQSVPVALTDQAREAVLDRAEAQLTTASGELIVYLPRQADALPRIELEGSLYGMALKSDVRVVSVRYENDGNVFEGYAKIKIQGNSSLGYKKKNYTIKLYADPECEEKAKFDMGWGAQNEYCLKANWIDKTHARNIVTARLAARINEAYGLHEGAPNFGAIDGFPVEITLNGNFWGLYTLNIPKDAWLFGMDSKNPDHIVLCAENYEDPTAFLADPDFEAWSVETGEENQETLEKLQRLVDFVRFSTDAEFRENLSQYVSVDALLNYYIMADIAWMKDNVTKNMLLVTYDGTIWIPTLYDLDTTWGSHWTGTKEYPYRDGDVDLGTNLLLKKLQRNFRAELAQRYSELRSQLLTKENIMEMFETFEAGIPEDIILKEKMVWGCNIPGFGLDQISEYLDIVLPRLDRKYAQWEQG